MTTNMWSNFTLHFDRFFSFSFTLSSVLPFSHAYTGNCILCWNRNGLYFARFDIELTAALFLIVSISSFCLFSPWFLFCHRSCVHCSCCCCYYFCCCYFIVGNDTFHMTFGFKIEWRNRSCDYWLQTCWSLSTSLHPLRSCIFFEFAFTSTLDVRRISPGHMTLSIDFCFRCLDTLEFYFGHVLYTSSHPDRLRVPAIAKQSNILQSI